MRLVHIHSSYIKIEEENYVKNILLKQSIPQAGHTSQIR